MKPGVRALGVAESYGPDAARSILAGAVVRADARFDGLSFSTSAVGGTDVTDGIATVYERLEREDVRYVLVAGVALSWYNLLDLEGLAERVDRPVIAVTFEKSDGLEAAIEEAFDGARLEDRLDRYRGLPKRHGTTVQGHELFYRTAGIDPDDGERVLRHFAGDGGRPEPLRVARLAARAADTLRRSD